MNNEHRNTVSQRRKYISWAVAAVILALAVSGIWMPRLRYLALGFLALWLTWRTLDSGRRAGGDEK